MNVFNKLYINLCVTETISLDMAITQLPQLIMTVQTGEGGRGGGSGRGQNEGH